ncbi:BC1872 family protein [Siminovitchia terrae]|uniref:BC1872 family protein n=1 Tax=Siminovitchia terrae TaxID=1914933 RepID=UPI0028A81A3C|nr:hypothetical protein [Siminovitchia terrae]
MREIDRLVAEKVMGWRLDETNFIDYWVGEHDGQKGDWAIAHMWKPSTNIQDAWEVVEKINEEFSLVRTNDTGMWVASIGFFGDECPECGEETFEVEYQGIANAAPLAICLAALKAVGVEVEVDGKVPEL